MGAQVFTREPAREVGHHLFGSHRHAVVVAAAVAAVVAIVVGIVAVVVTVVHAKEREASRSHKPVPSALP